MARRTSATCLYCRGDRIRVIVSTGEIQQCIVVGPVLTRASLEPGNRSWKSTHFCSQLCSFEPYKCCACHTGKMLLLPEGQDGYGLQRGQVVRNREVIRVPKCRRRASVCIFREDRCVIEVLRGMASCSSMKMTQNGKKFVMKSQQKRKRKRLTNCQGYRLCGSVGQKRWKRVASKWSTPNARIAREGPHISIWVPNEWTNC